MRCHGERRVHIALTAFFIFESAIGWRLIPNLNGIFVLRIARRGNGRQNLVINQNGFSGVLRGHKIFRHNQCDWIAHEPHAIRGKRQALRHNQAGQGQRAGQGPQTIRLRIISSQNGMNAFAGPRFGDINGFDPRMGVR